MTSRLLILVLALAALPIAACDPDASELFVARSLPSVAPPGSPGWNGGAQDGGAIPGDKIPEGPIADAGTPPPSGGPGGSTGPVDAGTTTPAASDEAYCVELINEYRAMVGKPAYTLSAELQASATTAAEADSMTGIPHGNFSFGGGGGAFAENEIPGWPLESTVREVIRGGLQMMWEEGPGGGHYDNMTGDYTEAGCGIHVTGRNSVWSAQRFR